MRIHNKSFKKKVNNIRPRGSRVRMKVQVLRKFGKPKKIQENKMTVSTKLRINQINRNNNIKGKKNFKEDSRIKTVSITIIMRSRIKKWMPVSWTEHKNLFLRTIQTFNSTISTSKTHLKMCKDLDLDLKTLGKILTTTMAIWWTIIKINIMVMKMEFTIKITSNSSTKTGMDDNNSTDITKGPISPKWPKCKGIKTGMIMAFRAAITIKWITSSKPTNTMRWVINNTLKGTTPLILKINRSIIMASSKEKKIPMTTLILTTFDTSNEFWLNIFLSYFFDWIDA